MRLLRRLGKIVAVTIGALVLVVVVILFGVRTRPGARVLLRAGLALWPRYFDGTLRVGRIQTDLLSRLVLEDVEVLDPLGRPAASARRIALRWTPWALRQRRLDLRSIEIDGGNAIVRTMPDGRINFAALLRPRPPSDEGPSRFRVEIGAARAAIRIRYEPPPDLDLPPLEAPVELAGRARIGSRTDVEVESLTVTLEKPTAAWLHARGAATIDSGDLRLRRIAVELDAEGEALRPFVARPRLRGAYHASLVAEGSLDALGLAADVSTPSQPIHADGQVRLTKRFGWRGRLRTRGLEVDEVVVGAPHLSVTLDAEGEGHGRLARATIRKAEVDGDGNHVEGHGRLNVDRGEVEGVLDLEIDAPHLERLRGLPKAFADLAGTLSGRAHVEQRRHSTEIDADLQGQGLRAAGLSARTLALHAHGSTVGAQGRLDGRDVGWRSVGLRQAGLLFSVDRQQFSIAGLATVVAKVPTTIELRLHGAPRYGRGPWPSGVQAVVDRLTVHRARARYAVRPGSTVTYDAHHLTTNLRADGPDLRVAIDASVPVEPWAKLASSRVPWHARIEAELRSFSQALIALGLSPPARLAPLDGKAKLSASLDGTPRRPSLRFALDGDELRYETLERGVLRSRLRLEDGRLEADGSLTLASDGRPAGKLVARVRAELAQAWARRGARLGERIAERAPMRAELELAGLRLGALPLETLGVPRPLDGGVIEGKGVLKGPLARASLQGAFSVMRLRYGRVRDLDARFVVDGGSREIRLLGALAQDQALLVEVAGRLGFPVSSLLGGVPAGATVAGRAVVPGFDLTRLEASWPGLAGRLRGRAFVRGPWRGPAATASLWVEGAATSAVHYDVLAAKLSHSPGLLEASVTARELKGGSLDASLKLAGGQLDADVRAAHLPLDVESRSYSFPLRRLRGVLDGQLRAQGPLETAGIDGRLVLETSALALAADPREIKDGRLELELSPGEMRITKLSGVLGPGRFEAAGSVGLAGLRPVRVNLTARTEQLPAVQHPVPVALDATIKVTGERHGDTISGVVRVDPGSARIPTLTRLKSLQSTGDLADVTYVDARGRRRAARRARAAKGARVRASVEVQVPGPFYLRSKELDADLSGVLTIRALGDLVTVSGQLAAAPGGHVSLFDQRYEIARGRVSFDGGPELDPAIDLKITRQVSQAAIGVELAGTVKRPEVHFTSEPPIYNETQVLQAMLGGDPGQPAAEGGLDAKVTGALSGLLVGAIKNQLFPQLPIDVLKVEVADTGSTSGSTTRLEVGKYLWHNVFVSYVHQFGTVQIGTRQLNANEAQLEYRFRRRFALDVAIGDAPAGRADLVWTIRY